MQLKSITSRARYVSFLALAACFYAPNYADAQTAEAKLFTPAGPWSVGATELSNIRGLGGMKMPCVLSNEFDNGFVVRFSGGGQKMLAMAMDFRQDVFAVGRQYNVMISLGDGYIKQAEATAFTKETLIFNLRPLEGFYTELEAQKTMEIGVENNNFRFSLDGLDSKITMLEDCYKGKQTQVIEPLVTSQKNKASQEVPALPAEIEKQELPKSFDEIVQESSAILPQQNTKKISTDILMPMPDLPNKSPKISKRIEEEKVIAPKPVMVMEQPVEFAPSVPEDFAADAPAKAMKTTSMNEPVVDSDPNKWTALAGEDVRDVLNRWALRAGYDLNWQSTANAKVVQGINMQGSFEEAVAQLMAESGATSEIEAAVSNQDDVAPSRVLSQSWKAKKGADLKSVIGEWAATEGVKFDWQIAGGFKLKDDFLVNGAFETAIGAILDQYIDDPLRPVGELNISPSTGVKTLTISKE